MMAFGTLFYMVGFAMFGLVSTYPLFVTAIVVITIGEMIVVPVSQGLAANFAPEEMRGRYMAVFGLSWAIPHRRPRCWRVTSSTTSTRTCCGTSAVCLCALSALSYYGLHLRLGKRESFAPKSAATD